MLSCGRWNTGRTGARVLRKVQNEGTRPCRGVRRRPCRDGKRKTAQGLVTRKNRIDRIWQPPLTGLERRLGRRLRPLRENSGISPIVILRSWRRRHLASCHSEPRFIGTKNLLCSFKKEASLGPK